MKNVIPQKLISWIPFSIALVSVIAIFYLTYTSSRNLMNYYQQDLNLKVEMRAISQLRLFSNILLNYSERLSEAKNNHQQREQMFGKIFNAYDSAYAQIGNGVDIEYQKTLNRNFEYLYNGFELWSKGRLDQADISALNAELKKICDDLAAYESKQWKMLANNYAFLKLTDKKQDIYFYVFAAMILFCFIFAIFLIVQKDQAVYELKLAQEELDRERIRRIQIAKMTTLGEMAAGIAHEINNPLMVIVGSLAKIKRNLNAKRTEDEVILGTANKIEEMSLRISKIVTGLLYFSRDGHKDPMKLIPVEQIVNDSLSLTEAKIKWHHIDLKLEIDDSAGQIYCRPWEVSQILINLINNSIDALESRENKTLKISARSQKNCVQLEILDSGPGVPECDREKIFQPFYTTKQVGKGVGLGLSISKGIAEDHNGRLILGKSDSGAKFIVEFPAD